MTVQLDLLLQLLVQALCGDMSKNWEKMMGGEVLLRTVTEGVGENGGMGSVMVCSLRGYFLTPADGGEAGASSGVRKRTRQPYGPVW